jgi:uncharacterized protein (TIGR02246 family)
MSLPDLFERYDGAWARGDVDAIVSMHSEDSVFHFHAGEDEAKGRDAIRATFGELLERYPDLRFERRNVRFADELIVFEYVIHTGGVSMEAVDLFTIAGGLVARKDTYVDATVLAAAQATAA